MADDIFTSGEYSRNLYKTGVAVYSSDNPTQQVTANSLFSATVDEIATTPAAGTTTVIQQQAGGQAAGKTKFDNTETGYILGIDSSVPKFYIGNTTNYLNWTGSQLIVSGNISATTGSIGGFTIGADALYAGDGATKIQLDTTQGIFLGANTFAAAPTSISLAGALTATAGTIGGWDITSTMLRSATSSVRIELDKGNNRISIFDATNEKVVMGYLNGLPKHDGTGNWGAGNYGFWARTGDMLSIDGDSEYVSGDWLIQNDASYLVKDASANTIIRLGTDTGEKGLFIYNTAGTQLAKLISDEIYIGSATNYLQYTIAGGLKLYSNDSDALTFDYGSNTLYKEGGSINFTSVTAPTACTATLIATGTGNVDDGTHSYKVTYVNTAGETELGAVSNTVTVDASNKQVALSDIPVSTSGSVTARKIYRTKAGGSLYYLLTTISDNSTTTYTDNTADVNLTGETANFRENNSFGKIFIDGIQSLILGNKNTYVGYNSGFSNTTGIRNTGIGKNSLYAITDGTDNMASGESSLLSNTIGSYNTAIGIYSLYSNTTGTENTALGYKALYTITTGNLNTAVGALALSLNLTGETNTAIGYASLKVTTGESNVGSGAYTLNKNTTGSFNTASGFESLYKNTTGDFNTAIGYDALYNNLIGTNNIALGSYAGRYETGSNAFYVNNQSRTNIAGDKAKSLLYGVMAADPADQDLTINANIFNSQIKSGATQAGAGAAANEIWKTASHATLPDNVLMIGV